jgi:oxygen-independent coproporphyrinogen-3 oxidase
MKAQTVGAILDAIAECWPIAANAEITLEANPTSVEATRFAAYRTAGVNRVSLGVQALNDADLLALGRQHSAAEALAAVEIAAKTFERFSFDLIYARSNQSLKDWEKELKSALLRTKDHLSLYQLTLEQGTIFEKLAAKGALSLPDADLGRAFWDLTQEIMECAGLPAYEVSNHARQGAESRHNLIYWRYGEYAGIGPGAHGRILTAETRLAQATEKHPDLWLNRVETLGHGLIEDEALDAAQQGDEFLLMGLRLAEGIDLARFEAIAGMPINPRAIASLVEENLVEYSGAGRLRVSETGFPLLNSVIAYLAV